MFDIFLPTLHTAPDRSESEGTSSINHGNIGLVAHIALDSINVVPDRVIILGDHLTCRSTAIPLILIRLPQVTLTDLLKLSKRARSHPQLASSSPIQSRMECSSIRCPRAVAIS